ncbi:MAG TPA: DNA-binding protein [Methanocella sp.]|uniref:NOB1 family endonuclease n=1 Tax=Methanocella sp. TaxID=2052833 RepID=UPI002CE78246|nr:DNA-binding protein [Methanocella sp.]HTY90832.1 DNA-binding protein [Methanocella sp.]
MPQTYVLDASAFIYGMFPGGELVTPPKVYAEVKDEASALKLEMLTGLAVREPEIRHVEEVKKEARETGDIMRLSPSDVDLLALAAEERAAGKDVAILSDDYAVQNVARKMGLAILPLHQKRIKYKIVWEKRCIGCNRTFPEGDVCPVCGSPLKLRKRSAKR